MFHPVVDIDRLSSGPESLIQVHLEPVGEDRRDAVIRGVCETLGDVRSAVEDFESMVGLMERAHGGHGRRRAPPRSRALDEALAFLRWLTADHFVFLGARCYDYRARPRATTPPTPCWRARKPAWACCAIPQRMILRRTNEPAVLTMQMKRQIDLDEPLTVGRPIWTAASIAAPRWIHHRAPLRPGRAALRRGPLRGAVHGRGLRPPGHRGAAGAPQGEGGAGAGRAHAGRATTPSAPQHRRELSRDELFQATVEELLSTSVGSFTSTTAARAAVRAARPLRPLHLDPDLLPSRTL
jgi:glutamate dehydrogenase